MIDLSIGRPIAPKHEMLSFLNISQHSPYLVIDTESNPETGHYLGNACAFAGGMGMYFPVGHLEDINVDDEVFETMLKAFQASPLRIMHNAAHDLQVIEDQLEVRLNGRFADTMIMAHMIDENVLSKSLDYLHKYYVTGGTGKDKHSLMQDYIDNMGWMYVPVQLMNVYSTQDAVATGELFEVLEPLFISQYGALFNG